MDRGRTLEIGLDAFETSPAEPRGSAVVFDPVRAGAL